MANVPDIDDEEEILSEQMERFEKTLHYSELSSTIHHFNSLAMLDQVIFVLKRPNSKIAREYRVLVESLVRENIEDAQGAIMFLEEQQNFRSQRATPRTALDPKLAIIKEIHGLNPDVLRRLATLRRLQRKPNEALALWDQVIQLGAVDTESLLERAELNADAGKHEVALQDLARLFSLSDAGGVDVSSAVRLQLVLDPKGVAQISKSPLITSVDGDTLTEIARELEISTETLTILEEVFQRWLGNHGSEESEETMDDVRLEYVLCLIGLGRFDKAKLTISETRPLASQLDIYMAFNYAMAEWGASGTPPMDMISQVLVEHENSGERRNANYYQCISLAYYLKDDRIQANEYANRALTAMAEHSDSTFSSWSYLAVPAERFALEVHDMIDSFSKNSVKPLFISRTSN
jgi:tetratricopeptide (TPR) repeat protein